MCKLNSLIYHYICIKNTPAVFVNISPINKDKNNLKNGPNSYEILSDFNYFRFFGVFFQV